MHASRFFAVVLLIVLMLSPAGTSAAVAEMALEPIGAAYVPADGTWTGHNGAGRDVQFTVSGGGTTWTDFMVDWAWSSPGCTGSGTTGNTGPGAITNNNFSKTTTMISFTGHFTSAYTATGTYGLELNTACGHLSESGTWAASTTMPPPGAFGKASPADAATVMTLMPTLSWGASTNATQYAYCYDTSDDDACDGAWLDAGTRTSAAVSGLLASTTYYWQVRADNSGGTTYADGAATWWSFTAGAIMQQPFTSKGGQDGWVLESSELSGAGGTMNSTLGTFSVGDDAARKQYRAILSFDTSDLSDTATISAVTLKIKKSAVSGNPFATLGKITVDMKLGVFGTGSNVQLADFKAAASKLGAMTISNTPVGGWYTKSLNAANYGYVNRNGLTQLRLRFAKDDDNDGTADLLKFYSGNALNASYRPVLVIEYYEP